jgi:hypothetical protein
MTKSEQKTPNGGFPPIYICNDDNEKSTREYAKKEIKKQNYKTHNTSVSIKKIMELRRNANPFIKT